MLYSVKDGKIRAKAIEYSVAYHCNLKCSACSHMSPYISKEFPTLESFERDLEALTKVLHVGDIRMLGGEPLQNPQVVDFLKAARRSGIADQIMLTTNGLLLAGMSDEFWESVDFIWLSLYPNREPPPKAMEKIKAKAKESNTRLDIDPTSHFRATYLTEPQPKDLITDMIFKTCGSAHNYHCHMLYEGKVHKCAVPPFLPEFLAKMGKNGYDPAVDAFDVHASTDLFNDLKDFLFKSETLEACKWCVGYVGKWEAHHQLAPAELANAATEPRSRASHLSWKHLAKETASYCYRRVTEKVTGKPKW
ncbi:MAG: radical SAM protein [Gemmatimonadota bacterium]